MKKTEVNKIEGRVLYDLELSHYIIGVDGTIWGDRKDKIMSPLKKTHGYRAVYLTHDQGYARWYLVHRLVAMAYIPNPDNLPIVRHLDNDPTNNHKDNLAWGTHKENSQQMVREKRRVFPKGESHPMYGKKANTETRKKMSAAKLGVLHPKFKGYYIYKGESYPSLQALADKLKTYPVKIHRMVKSGKVVFSSVTYSELSR